jgi:hypothetical protein
VEDQDFQSHIKQSSEPGENRHTEIGGTASELSFGASFLLRELELLDEPDANGSA